MSKSWPDYMGTYKAIVLDTTIGKTKNDLPQFVIRACLSELFDTKEGEWMDVSDNNWSINAYLSLYGRKDSKPDGDMVATLNHQQVCAVFGWDGCGFSHLRGDFSGKIIQMRISENTYENAKTPVRVDWIDVEGADPSGGLQKLEPDKIKDLEAEFAHMWAGKKVKPVASAPKTGKAKAAPAPTPPPTDVAVDKTEAVPFTDDKKARKAALLAKSKRLQKEAAKPLAECPPAKASAELPPTVAPVPAGYDKQAAWCDVVDGKNDACEDDQLRAAWDAAIATIAEGGDEDKLDNAGWSAVKDAALNDVGKF